jgi:transcriptional regulator with XRE-family HTH domain
MRIDPDAARFGAILKRLREQKGWTRQKLAQRAGMTQTYIADIMRRLAAARVTPAAVLPPQPPASET